MSRHVVREDEAFQVVIGWDPPLQTFFVQVHDQTEPDEEKRTIVFEGTRPGQFEQPWDVKRRVKQWVNLDDTLLITLRHDQVENRP